MRAARLGTFKRIADTLRRHADLQVSLQAAGVEKTEASRVAADVIRDENKTKGRGR